jgi:hypothetical protein
MGRSLGETWYTQGTNAQSLQFPFYAAFSSTMNSCPRKAPSQGKTNIFIPVTSASARNLDTASSLWDIRSARADETPVHDGAVFAIQSGKLDAFIWVAAGSSGSLSIADLESKVDPMLARKL